MGSITRMSSKCNRCAKREKCNKKKMEACAFIEESNLSEITVKNTIENALPNARATMTINVGGVLTSVYKDEIQREISKVFREPFALNYASQKRGG